MILSVPPRKGTLNRVSTLFDDNFGVKTNRCPNLAFQIEMPVKDNEVIEHLTPEETRRFLDCARTWPARDVGNMLLLAFFTGMRRGEMFKLQDEDVAFDLKLIRLRDPKGRKTLSIGMSSLVEELLQEQMAWRDEHFPGTTAFSHPGHILTDDERRKKETIPAKNCPILSVLSVQTRL